MELNNKIDELFSLMDSWRMLPAYQLERRADIFFALYMNTIIKAKYGDEIDILIPEFPVRVGDIIDTAKNPNMSFKIDYVAVSESSKRVYFIELKTDNSSRREKQDDYLEKARGINIIKLIDGVLAINKATKQKRKYKNLLSILNMAGWVTIENDICSNVSTPLFGQL